MAEPKIRFKNKNGEDYPEWIECTLNDVFTERNESHLITEDAPQLSFTIEQGVINPEDKKTNKRDFLMKDKANKKFLLTEYNDIIYNPANLKFGAIHRNKLGRGVVSPIYAIFKTDQNPVYMEYVVRNPRFIKRSLKYLEGTVIKLMTLKPRDFVKMKVSIPCVEEQGKIAEFMENIDSIIAASEKEIEKLYELKKGCLQRMFPRNGADVPEVRFPEFTDEWEQRKLGEVFEQTSNFVNPNQNDIELWSLTVEDGLTPKSERYEREYLVKKENNYKEVRPGDIVYNPMNMTLGAVGYNGMSKSVAVSGYYTTMVVKNGNDAYYINTWLKSPQALVLFKTYATGSLIEKQRVQFPTLSIIPAKFPSYDEQRKIGKYFEDLDKLISVHQSECEKYKELKNGLLQKMFV